MTAQQSADTSPDARGEPGVAPAGRPAAPGAGRRAVVKRRSVITAGLICAALAVIVLWVIRFRQVNYWFEVHTGTVNEPGPYYGFWSGFGSDLEEFGIFGAIGAGIYQLVRKYNCHEPGCWRIGQHPAAGGQFLLCYRHHPDYRGKKPTHELIERLHREHLERQASLHGKLDNIHQHPQATPAAPHRANGAGATATTTQTAVNH